VNSTNSEAVSWVTRSNDLTAATHRQTSFSCDDPRITRGNVAERTGPDAAAAQEESARLPGAAQGDGPHVTGRSLGPELGEA